MKDSYYSLLSFDGCLLFFTSSIDRYNGGPRSEVPQSYQYNPDHAQERRTSQSHDISPSAARPKPRVYPTYANGTTSNSHPANTNMSSYGSNGLEQSSGNNHHHQMEYSPSQSYRNRSTSLGNRKRAYEEMSSSEESEEEARRQEDDITPRLKRRQPKVAEAYR